MAQPNPESHGSLTIRGTEIPTITKMVEQESLRFYVDNPRVYSVLRASGKEPSQEEIEERLQKLEHVKELRESIKANHGLIEPLVVKQGSMEVLEGNSRLAAYRALVKADPVKWEMVKCTLLPPNISESLVFALLGEYHVKGKKDWAPYEQAGFLYRRFHKHGADVQALAREIGISVKEINRLIEVYSFMVDNGQNDIDKWSYYDEYIRSNKIRKARVQHPELDQIIIKKIQSKEIEKAVDLRDKLPTICSSPKTLNKFAVGSYGFEKAYDAAVSSGGDNTTLNQIKRFREMICRTATESHLQGAEPKVQKVAIYEMRKIGDRVKHLLIKMK